jgi:hypothetical protein
MRTLLVVSDPSRSYIQEGRDNEIPLRVTYFRCTIQPWHCITTIVCTALRMENNGRFLPTVDISSWSLGEGFTVYVFVGEIIR